jgi:hypothetical protein
LRASELNNDLQGFTHNSWTAATSGTGASTSQILQGKVSIAPTSAVGHALLYNGIYAISRGSSQNSPAVWGKRYELSFRLINSGTSPFDANSVGRVLFGKTNSSTTPGLAVRGFGIQLTIGGTLQVLAHDGTTLTTYNTSHTVVHAQAIDINLVLSAAGNVECFVNGSSVGSTSGGPTSGTNSTGNAIYLEAENLTSLTDARIAIIITNPRVLIQTS